MSARKRRWRQAVKPAATHLSPAAAKLPNNLKRSASAARVVASATTSTRLPASLERRLTDMEARLGAVEQLSICPMACARERCAFRCPLPEGGAQ